MNFPDNSPIDLYCPSQLRLYFLPFLNWLFITLSLTDVLTAALCEWLFLSPGCKTLTQQFRFSRLKIFLRRQNKAIVDLHECLSTNSHLWSLKIDFYLFHTVFVFASDSPCFHAAWGSLNSSVLALSLVPILFFSFKVPVAVCNF